MSDKYILQHGDVWYREIEKPLISSGLRHVCDGTEELAVIYQGDILVKIGSAKSLRKWYDKNASFYHMDDESPDLELVSFPVCEETVEELNKLNQNSNRVSILIDNLIKIGETKQIENKI